MKIADATIGRYGKLDSVTVAILRLAGVLAGAIVLLIVLFLVRDAWPALRTVGLTRFFSDSSWHPAGGAEQGRFNLTPMLVGTLLATAGAIAVAAPLGIACALFTRFYAPRRIGQVHRRVLELLAGIPSVVYGFWGLVVLAPLIAKLQPPGQSLLAAIVILAIMILPTVALLSDAALRSVPAANLQAAHAMGLSRLGVIFGAALPAARGGIATAVLLATGRAIGETMAVLMVAGNVVQVPHSVFDPVRTMTANIALELGYAMDHHRAALFVSGLMLMLMIIVLVGLSEWMGRSRSRG